MHIHTKTIIATITAILLMALAVTTATATRLSISHGELATVQFNQLRFQASGITQAECNVTLEGSFHTATVVKTANTLIGYVSRAILGTCSTGRVTILTESLPWHLQYGGFNEVLPRPRVILNLILSKFNINSFFGNCLATTSTTNPARGSTESTWERNGNGIVTDLVVDNTALIVTTCGINGRFGGSGRVFEWGGLQNFLLRLI